MSKLAAGIIVESDVRAKELRRLLQNITPHVDAVFLTVNNRPDAKIKALADEFGCRYSFLAWDRDFATQRNFNFEQIHKAGYEFIFWVDTDDTVKNPEVLRKLVDSWPEGLDGYAATYHYAKQYGYDATTHVRERLMRWSPERMKWVGRVHEQIICEQPSFIETTKDFAIIHHSKGEKKDKAFFQTNNRNLEILLLELHEQGDRPDPRTLIQLGRTYFGQARLKEMFGEDPTEFYARAVYYLEQYIPLSGWDEERYEATCIMGDCMRSIRKDDLAEKFYYRAVMELNNRYQAYEGLIRLYFEQGKYDRVIFWYDVMNSFPPPQTNHFQSEVSTKLVCASFYAKSLFQVGRYREGWMAWQDIARAYPNHPMVKEDAPMMVKGYQESLALEGIANIAHYLGNYDKVRAKGFFEALPRDLKHNELVAKLKREVLPPRTHGKNEVTIFCGPIGLEEWAYPSISKGIGGSEEAVINVSQELNTLGYKVTVYNMCGNLAGEYNGVTYAPYYELNIQDKFNIFISWRDLMITPMITAAKKWIWLHDVPNPDTFTPTVLKSVDKIIVLSPYHRSLLPNVPDDKIFVSRNGVNLNFFTGKTQRDPNLVIYTSSPERGLDEFLDIAEAVKKERPETRFEAYYGWQNNDAARGGDPEYQEWKRSTNERIEKLGMPAYTRLSHRAIAAKMEEAGVWLYPTAFPEISCIAAMKAQIAGAIPVCSDFAALNTTVEHGFKIGGEYNKDKYVAQLKDVLDDPEKAEVFRQHMMSEVRGKLSWTGVAEDWQREWQK